MTKAKFKSRTFHEPYFIVTINFIESTLSESTEYKSLVLYGLAQALSMAGLVVTAGLVISI